MSPPTERTGPPPGKPARPLQPEASIRPGFVAALRARRRNSRLLDELLGVNHPTVDLTAISANLWHDTHMDLGVRERGRAA